MKAVFADTSFYVALLNPADAQHASAEKLMKRGLGRVVTSDYVLWELANYLAGTSGRALFAPFSRQLQESDSTRIIRASRPLLEEGIGLYARHRDKAWSLTDCISFVVMRRESILDVLTADHHFIQAGFRSLLA